MLGRLGRSEDASTSSVGLAIAAATIATAFVVANLMVAEPQAADHRASTYALASTTALEIVVGDGGHAQGGVAWEKDPDRMARFGLATGKDRNFLDYAKIKALRNGTFTAAANGQPDYPEVKEALGLREADFHLRSYPVLPDLEDPRWTKETHGRVAYFARYGGAVAAAGLATGHYLSPASLNVTVEITNAAAAPAVFVATVSLANKTTGTTYVTEERHTPLLAPGATHLAWVEFHPLASWDARIDGVKIELQDPYGNPALDPTATPIGAHWILQRPPTTNPHAYGLLLHAASPYAASGQTVQFIADHYTGAGGKVDGAQAQFVLVGPNGREWHNTTLAENLPKNRNQVYAYDCPNCTTPGTYTAILWDTAFQRRLVDQIHVSPTVLFTEKTTMDPIAIKEINLLATLVAGFNPTRHDPATNPTGDVFADDGNGAGALVALLPRYTTLVIGSEVSQTALAPAGVKYAIAEWVQRGGNLLVLGTVNSQSRWIEPVYHAAQVTANGGISAPDPTHPILQAPNRLSYERYLDRGRAWHIKDGQPFTHVLSRGASGDGRDDTLAVSHPGAYSNGTVVLTSYMPGALTSPQDDAEARRLLHNLMTQSHTMLFLDYGPPVPPGVPVGSDSRLVAVPHPNVPGAVVEVRLVMYVFG